MNKIHPTVTIIGDVELGEQNEVLPYSVLIGPLRIGSNNWIGPHVVIGTPGEDTKNPRRNSSNDRIAIGDHNIIREHVAIQKPCYEEVTEVGNYNFIMHGAHVPHDAILSDQVTLAPNVVIGGITKLLEGCNIGMGATVHQNSIIGHYSIVSTNAAAIKNVKPFSRFIPGKPISVNDYAINKFGFQEYYDEIHKYVLEGRAPESLPIMRIVEEFEILHANSNRKLY
jgi:UDP-N-acetylglucosamine acyltransferase